MTDDFEFAFQFEGQDRAALMAQARTTVMALNQTLSNAPPKPPTAAEKEALALLERFDHAVAELSGFPDVIPLKEQHFLEHELAVPRRFKDLQTSFRFYWLRFPTVLKPAPGTIFNKLECGVSFNPGATPQLLPKAIMILPDRKFQRVLSGNLGASIQIGESFEFEASTPKIEQEAIKAGAGVSLKAATELGLVAGPFNYDLKHATVDHTAPGAERVFWTLSGSEFTETDDLAFVVVLQVPKDVQKVEIAAALRACHRFNPAASVADVFSYLGARLKSFFEAGAPTNAPTKVWDISAKL